MQSLICRSILFTIFLLGLTPIGHSEARPNILFYFVDDWGRYASCYSQPGKPSLNDIVQTPNFDRIAHEGVMFNNAFVHVSSCGPSRASLTTGQYFWKCGSGAFLNGRASDWKRVDNPFRSMIKFPDLLREHGYYASKVLKTLAFDPSIPIETDSQVPRTTYQRYGLYVGEAGDQAERERRIEEVVSHPRYEMRRVLRERQENQPFFFVYGTINVHRPYHAGSGRELWNIDPDSLRGRLPKFLPDVEEVRRDFADYLGEVQAADAMFGEMLSELASAGELDHTLIILTGDNGIPGIPRGKTNCYDLSVHAPMMVRWPSIIPAGRIVNDFVSLIDIGPTLLEAAGVTVPNGVDGRSFYLQLVSEKQGWIDTQRDRVIVGRELHFHSARDGNLPYPMRGIRTKDFLYIRNFKPERWPNGAPYNIDETHAGEYEYLDRAPYRDLDGSLTKIWLLNNRESTDATKTIDLTLGKRPGEELYDIRIDPDQQHNLAGLPEMAEVKYQLANELMTVLKTSGDPRLQDAFDKPPYVIPLGD